MHRGRSLLREVLMLNALRLASVLIAVASCGRTESTPTTPAHPERPSLADRPSTRASRAFWQVWGDGKAEVAAYETTVPRYGELWSAELVLITVSETLDRHTLIKDDDARGAARLPVLKLNASLRFQTGFYPYSVLTSVFMPVDRYASRAFAPVKITLGALEWCGHVYASVFPKRDAFDFESRSYFASEGDFATTVTADADTLYEDALLVQLRELDGPFANGGTWNGKLVPSLWRNRRAHADLAPVPARITRSSADGNVRFVLTAGTYERVFEVQDSGERLLLSYRTNDGEEARLIRSQRVRYWEANRHGGEATRDGSGLDATPLPRPAPPSGTRAIAF